MKKERVIEALAEYYEIEPDETGKYDLDDYEFTSGCRFNGAWLSLANVIGCLEDAGLIE